MFEEDKIGFFALYRIESGDELTIDYGYDPDEVVYDGYDANACNCGSANCRGVNNFWTASNYLQNLSVSKFSMISRLKTVFSG